MARCSLLYKVMHCIVIVMNVSSPVSYLLVYANTPDATEILAFIDYEYISAFWFIAYTLQHYSTQARPWAPEIKSLPAKRVVFQGQMSHFYLILKTDYQDRLAYVQVSALPVLYFCAEQSR